MKDDRKNLHRHIQAARNWLSLAEKSIEKEDDLQGDLKLMLAKAELKNAEKHQNKNLLKKISPLAAALVISCGIFAIKNTTDNFDQFPELSFNTSLTASSDEAKNQPFVSSTADLTKEQTKLNANADLEIKDSYNEEMRSEGQSLEKFPSEAENVELKYSLEVVDHQEYDDWNYETDFSDESGLNSEQSGYIQPEQAEQVKEDVINLSITPEIKAPPEDMQKLMQSAGQILRAE